MHIKNIMLYLGKTYATMTISIFNGVMILTPWNIHSGVEVLHSLR